MSLEISMRLPDLKKLLVLACGLELVWKHPTQKHFAMLEGINETYLKAIPCLSKFIHLSQAFLIKKTLDSIPAASYRPSKQLLEKMRHKSEAMRSGSYGSDNMINRSPLRCVQKKTLPHLHRELCLCPVRECV
jgi:hypothetical protein